MTTAHAYSPAEVALLRRGFHNLVCCPHELHPEANACGGHNVQRRVDLAPMDGPGCVCGQLELRYNGQVVQAGCQLSEVVWPELPPTVIEARQPNGKKYRSYLGRPV